MQVSKSSIYIAFFLCILILNVCCDKATTFDDITSSDDDLQKLQTFFYMSAEENLPTSEAQTWASGPSTTTLHCKELNEQDTQAAAFYKRLIAVMLSNLVAQKVDDKLIGVLSMEVSSSQFQYLQNFIDGQGSIREVDKILENVIKQPGYSAYYYMAEASYYINLLSDSLIPYLSIMKEHWDITIICLTVIVSFIILRRQRCSPSLIIFLMFDVIFVMSFFITWWRLIQEAEIKAMAAQAQFAQMPISCQPHKMSMWDKITASLFNTNDCEKYYQSIMSNPRLQVTPALALTHFLTTAIFQPLSYLGVVISEFIDNSTSKLGFLYKFPVTIALFLSLCICIILLPFSLIGGSINLGIGPFFRFGIRGRKKSHEERIDRIHEDTSSTKALKNSEKLKCITLEQDPAGGDTSCNRHHANKKHKCIAQCEKKEDSDVD